MSSFQKRQVNQFGGIYSIPKKMLENIVKKSSSFNEVLNILGYRNGKQHFNLKQKCLKEKIDTSHFIKNRKPNKKLKNSEIFIKSEKVSVTTVKARIIKDKLLEYKCSSKNCPVHNEWNGHKISLHLDHINGDRTDHRLSNLRYLCPNCHSQTSTYSGRNNKSNLPKRFCVGCNEIKISKNQKFCKKCYINKLDKEKIKRYSNVLKEIKKDLNKMSISKISKKYSISKTLIHKTLKMFKISKKRVSYEFSHIEKNNLSILYKNKPNFKLRKYNYDKMYKIFLKYKKYSLVANELKISRSTVRKAILRYLKQNSL